MTSTLITAYLGTGLLSARPATPAVATGAAAYWFATDTSVLSVYAGGAWSNVAGGGSATAFTPIASGYATIGVTGASEGTPFKPSLTLSFFKAYAMLTTVAGATYKMGFAPWDTVNRKITLAPMYSNVVTAGQSAANQTLKFDFAALQTATLNTDYILFIVRTDSTAGVSITMSYCTGALVGGPGYFRDVSSGSNMQLSSLAPLTSDVWTSGNNPWIVAPIYTV